jgi:hypothetical protein
VAFLFGYLSLWPRKEKVTRLPQADESSCSESRRAKQEHRAQARSYKACVVLRDGCVRFLPSQE